jgi:glycosyltransferase involved in cell wall biosynthesis
MVANFTTKIFFEMTIFIIIITIYVIWLTRILYGMKKFPETTHLSEANKHFFSIIIPFKNEAENLSGLLNSLEKLNYSPDRYEIILVNDYSTDKGEQIIKNHPLKELQLLNNSSKPSKKQALLTGIRQAKHPWIITTDADCKIPGDWLKTFDTIIQQQSPLMILGPVKLFDKISFLQQLQQVELMALQAITVAGVYWNNPFLSNGANLCFDKKTFFDLNAYEGNMQIMSGDDVFLLEKFRQKFPGRIAYAKTNKALVSTAYQKTPNDIIQQKIRWAGKTGHFKSGLPAITGLIILAANIMLIPTLLLAFENPVYIWFPVIKFTVDTILLKQVRQFIPFRFSFIHFVGIFVVYPLYYLIILLMSLQGGYRWKGKKYKI